MSEAQDLDYSQAASLTSSIFPSSNHRNRSESYGSTENCTMSSPLRQNPHIHPTIVSLPEKKSERKSKYECPAFQNEEDYDAYVDSISPSRELVCPITQEVLQDPVVAEDGHTYERSALMTWFSMGRYVFRILSYSYILYFNDWFFNIFHSLQIIFFFRMT